MKFLKRPELVEAVQWNGQNLEEVRKLLGVDLLYTAPGKNVIPLLTQVEKMHAAVGDWLVKAQNEAVVVFEPGNMIKFFDTYDFADMEGVCGCCSFKYVPVKFLPDEKAYICHVCLIEKTPQQREEQYHKNLGVKP